MENIEDKDYNTNRPEMVIPEYGRNIQKMVEHAISIENREERNIIAGAIISVMGQLNPHLRDIADFKHKLWDHLFIISDFKLDVDSPYPLPDKTVLFEKPKAMAYPETENRFKHYGKSVKNLIDAAVAIEDKDEQKALTGVILNLMKKTYLTFNQDSVDDNQIVTDLKIISKDQLSSPEGFQMISTNEVLAMTKKKNTHSNKNHKNHKNNKQSNYKKRRY
ncbi:MAG: methionyl-tRNA formyltransferase [Flavobacteriales bacterium]|nr:MAG: methionyl-tRNA formyltransferase [Flavobacteriales bacterium]